MGLRRSNAANAVLGLSQLSIATGGIFRLLDIRSGDWRNRAERPDGLPIVRNQLTHVCYNGETALRCAGQLATDKTMLLDHRRFPKSTWPYRRQGHVCSCREPGFLVASR